MLRRSMTNVSIASISGKISAVIAKLFGSVPPVARPFQVRSGNHGFFVTAHAPVSPLYHHLTPALAQPAAKSVSPFLTGLLMLLLLVPFMVVIFWLMAG